MVFTVLMIRVWLPVSRFIPPGKWGMKQKKVSYWVQVSSFTWRVPVELCLGCSTVRGQGVRPTGIYGDLTEIGSRTWKWMDFFYFSCVQDVSGKEEHFYYHSAALSNTQICISLARPKNLGKNVWGLWKWLNEWSPFPCGEYPCVVFHAGTTGLSVSGPGAWWLTDTSPCVLWLFVPSSG